MRTNLFINIAIIFMVEPWQTVAVCVGEIVRCFLPRTKLSFPMIVGACGSPVVCLFYSEGVSSVAISSTLQLSLLSH